MTDERLIAEARRPMTDMDITQDPAATRAFIRRLANALEDAEKRAETEHYAKNRARNERNEAREALAVFEKAQGEPSDAQALAFLRSFYPLLPTATFEDFSDDFGDRVRAGLRAASEVGGEGR